MCKNSTNCFFDIETKQCATCGQVKDKNTEFGNDKYQPDGKNTRCLICKAKESSNSYYKKKKKLKAKDGYKPIVED